MAVAYLLAADIVSGPLPSRLREVNQPVIITRNRYSSPRPCPLACICAHGASPHPAPQPASCFRRGKESRKWRVPSPRKIGWSHHPNHTIALVQDRKHCGQCGRAGAGHAGSCPRAAALGCLPHRPSVDTLPGPGARTWALRLSCGVLVGAAEKALCDRISSLVRMVRSPWCTPERLHLLYVSA